MDWTISVLLNIIRLSRKNIYFSNHLEFSNLMVNKAFGIHKNTIFQLNISKIMPDRLKNTGTCVVNTTLILEQFLLLTVTTRTSKTSYSLSFSVSRTVISSTLSSSGLLTIST